MKCVCVYACVCVGGDPRQLLQIREGVVCEETTEDLGARHGGMCVGAVLLKIRGSLWLDGKNQTEYSLKSN